MDDEIHDWFEAEVDKLIQRPMNYDTGARLLDAQRTYRRLKGLPDSAIWVFHYPEDRSLVVVTTTAPRWPELQGLELLAYCDAQGPV